MSGKITANIEDYLEAIYCISLKQEVVRVKDVAKELNITLPSVSGILNKLINMGFVEHEKYGYIKLTAKGLELGKEINRRHNLLLHFLADVLKIEHYIAENDACKIEHHISQTSLYRLTRFLEFLNGFFNEDNHAEILARFYDDLENEITK